MGSGLCRLRIVLGSGTCRDPDFADIRTLQGSGLRRDPDFEGLRIVPASGLCRDPDCAGIRTVLGSEHRLDPDYAGIICFYLFIFFYYRHATVAARIATGFGGKTSFSHYCKHFCCSLSLNEDKNPGFQGLLKLQNKRALKILRCPLC
jgi:hypothetical protein